MQKQRFWFGMALVVLPVMGLLLAASPRVEVSVTKPIEGHVSIHGRPLADGYIVFIPEDTGQFWAIGRIDQTGHYVVRPTWDPEKSRNEAGYRICLFPVASRPPERARPDPDRGKTLDAGSNRGSATFIRTSVKVDVPPHLSDPSTTQLKVHRGPPPSKVDIEL